MIVPEVIVENVNDPNLIKDILKILPETSIEQVNWPELYPSNPIVYFKIAHNRTHLFLQYFVEENEILAKVEEDNGAVWTDSCVEFFIQINDSPSYYNLELSCIGKALLGNRIERKDVVYGSPEVMSSIKRYPSLGLESFDNRQGYFKWDLLVVVPVSAYWQSGLKTFKGLNARGNFYKCGDNLTEPHYLSWSPISTEKPNFHVPPFFCELIFE
ncbi:carbohydrate-binding family 9-like protein [Dysgonomonas sp. Marseille-P4677]|uniref:carbohydrate-binding family 9-like protein n=1 Tax=Dysgonomonas sp. Marseille-P4677 TaxID=2364790 RepID=UPI001EFF2E03|nr:carbohydrate-binding family 9-like protein [Dysgonomonas sp. Marseille-P4677]